MNLPVPDLPVRLRDSLAGLLLRALRDRRARGTVVDAARLVAVPPGDAVLPAGVQTEPAATALAAGGLLVPALGPGTREAGHRRVETEWDGAVARRLERYLAAIDSSPEGEDLPARLTQARELLALELYFEVHEVLEPAWNEAEGERRAWLQGLIQASVAWYHAERGNLRGARSLVGAANARLRDAPESWLDFPVGRVRESLVSWDEWLSGESTGEPPTPALGPVPAPPLDG